jgi:hypothetical protein
MRPIDIFSFFDWQRYEKTAHLKAGGAFLAGFYQAFSLLLFWL